MSIKIGNTNIADIKLGNQNIKKVYRGSDLIWEKQSPTPTGDNKLTYDGTEYILIDNIDPNLFITYNSGYLTQTYPLKNGGTLEINYATNRAKLTSLELHTISKDTITGNFLYGCSGLTSLTLDLPNFTTFYYSFLSNCSGLTSLTLDLPSLTSTGYFLPNCSGLTSLTLWDQDPSTVSVSSSNFMYNCNPNEIKVPSQYISWYNSNSPWSAKSGKYVAKQETINYVR